MRNNELTAITSILDILLQIIDIYELKCLKI